MSSLLLPLVLAFLSSLGARDQLLVARLRTVLGPRLSLLILAAGSAVATAAIAAAVGDWLRQSLSEDAATMFVAMALFVAGGELAWPIRQKKLEEPTRSLAAIVLVLFSRQVSDAARFVIAALAVVISSPILIGIGGAIGGAAAMALAWSLGEGLHKRLPLALLRRVLAVPIVLAAIFLGLAARGIIA